MDCFKVIDKEAFECRAEVKTFDSSRLRRVQPRIRSQLPTPQTLRAELRPEKLPDVSAIRSFDCKLLKHVELRERNLLPSLEGNVSKMRNFVSIFSFAYCFC
eukprot:Seg152.2 transcript_id=Seg152.2/GoldUCD/mRNA.D3Y31 product="hypothetical protein" protein_id=Seg152.2/GoldUCD/D3Y31